MNIIDRVINIFSPSLALKRSVDRHKSNVIEGISNSGYSRHGASRFKKSLLGWFSKGGSPDDDIVDNLVLLRERSRDLFMGVPLATGALKTIRTNVIGSGLKLNCTIDAELLGLSDEDARKWKLNTEREFSLWADTQDCDAARTLTFGQMQALALLSALMNGDVFAMLPVIKRKGSPYDLRVNLIEGDRICNPEGKVIPDLYGGVEVDDYGAPLAYWLCKQHPAGTGKIKKTWVRLPAFGKKTGRRNILHLMQDFERPGQRRATPVLAPVIESLKQLGRYTDAELVAAVVSGMFTVFVKTEHPEEPLGQGIPDYQKIDPEPSDIEMGNGTVVGLAENESIETANPGRPNTAFAGFVDAICEQIGAALELPKELLVKHFTSSYSASRAALLEAWKMFRMRREWMVSTFTQPIYEEWLSEAVAKGRVYAPGFFSAPEIKRAWCSAMWYGPAQGQLDPLKEVNAAKVRVEEGFSTRSREAAELNGSNFETSAAVRGREEKLRRDLGIVPENSKTQQSKETDENDRFLED